MVDGGGSGYVSVCIVVDMWRLLFIRGDGLGTHSLTHPPTHPLLTHSLLPPSRGVVNSLTLAPVLVSAT